MATVQDDPGTLPQARTLRLLSVVAPMFNEEATAETFHRRVCDALEGLPFELVIVDDGSTDGTGRILERLADQDPRVRVVYLSRNFGHQTAITAGLDHAKGDAVVMIDADLQDPPEAIPRLLDAVARRAPTSSTRCARSGRGRRASSWPRRASFYRLISRLSNIELQQDAGDFRLMDRRALDALLSMRERSRYLRGMTVWVGFTHAAVPYERDARAGGETKYTLARDAALLAGRDLLLLPPAAAGRHRAGVRVLDRRLPGHPGRGGAQAGGRLPARLHARSRWWCCCWAASS